MAWSAWQDSTSAVVAAFRFDREREVLEIRSRRSGRVRAFRCTPERYAGFLDARSQGWVITRLAPVKRGWRTWLLPQ